MLFPPRSDQIRALADADSFFASCEIVKDPTLRGKPVCVCRDKDIIVASTYEAKKHHVTTGTPSREARRILGNSAVFLEPDFAWYGKMSQDMFACLRNHALQLKEFSIDEGFLQLPPFGINDKASYELLVQHIQHDVYQSTGLPITLGVAPTKLLAKIFAKLGKPFGFFVALDQEQIDKTLQSLHITKTPFIGERFAGHFPMCRTIFDFKNLYFRLVKEISGRSGLKLRLELNGINALRIERKKGPTVIGRRRSFHPHFTNDKTLLWSYLMHNFDKAYTQMLEEHVATRQIKVTLKLKSFDKFSHKKKLPQPTNNKQLLINEMKELFEKCYNPHYLYRTTSISFAIFTSLEHKQYDLFDEEQLQDTEQERLYEVIEQINHHRGKRVITTATSQYILQQEKTSTYTIGKVY